jgi:hypothetical protein
MALKKTETPALEQFLGEITKEAFHIYERRRKSGEVGDQMSDWFKAESTIKAKYRIH